MDTLIRKKIILHLLDCDSKSANEIANEIGELLAVIEEQLTALASENICQKVNQDEVDRYVVRKDIEAFARLVKEFLSETKEHDEETKQFITSEHYFARIDCELVNYVLKRFYLDSVYQADEEKQRIGRILLASPSALFFALHSDTSKFRELWAHWNQLNSSNQNPDRVTKIFCSEFMMPLLNMFIADIRTDAYVSLYIKLPIRMAKVNIQVSLATPDERYVEGTGGGILGFRELAENSYEDLSIGQPVTYINPIDFSNDGLALLNFGEFQGALDSFDKALNGVQNPNQKAIVLNNKGLAFLRLKQYQKAIECFEEGITFDSENELSELRENKQLAEEYLARATDADNLNEPTQIRFVQDQPVPFEETRLYEF